jgi:hypothetical protein
VTYAQVPERAPAPELRTPPHLASGMHMCAVNFRKPLMGFKFSKRKVKLLKIYQHTVHHIQFKFFKKVNKKDSLIFHTKQLSFVKTMTHQIFEPTLLLKHTKMLIK